MVKKDKKKSLPRRLITTPVKIAAIALVIILGVNFFVIKSNQDKIAVKINSYDDTVTSEEAESLKAIKPDCIMILGASVKKDGSPSLMLKDRLDTGIDLYKKGIAPKLLLSGDNGQAMYNEVGAMKDYAVSKGVSAEDIFLDHAGFSTYESVYRAGYIFQVDSMIVVTQSYHMYRALYGCSRMGIDALGVASDQKTYRGQQMREIREIMARDKDCVKWLFKPEPTFLGEAIPINGNGINTQ